MGNLLLVLGCGAAVLFALALREAVGLWHGRNRVETATGTVWDVYRTAGASPHPVNTGLARVCYFAAGQWVVSQNRMVMPWGCGPGDRVTVRYYAEAPERLFLHTPHRLAGFAVSAAVCVFLLGRLAG